MATVEELISCIDDPEDDSTRAYELVAELAQDKDLSLVPALTAAMKAFIANEHFYGRDVVADAIAEIQGAEALPLLLRASAVDIGDDQDSLQSTIVEVIWRDIARSRELVGELATDDDPRVRRKASWAADMVEYQASRKASAGG